MSPVPYSPKNLGPLRTKRGASEGSGGISPQVTNTTKLQTTTASPSKDGQAMRRHSASGQVTFEWDNEEEHKPQLWQRFLGQGNKENIKVSGAIPSLPPLHSRLLPPLAPP